MPGLAAKANGTAMYNGSGNASKNVGEKRKGKNNRGE